MSEDKVLRAIELLEQSAALFDEACMLLRQVAMQQENEVKAVARIVQNGAGQISMQDDSGGYFDMSEYVGEKLYLAPPSDKAIEAAAFRKAAAENENMKRLLADMLPEMEARVFEPRQLWPHREVLTALLGYRNQGKAPDTETSPL